MGKCAIESILHFHYLSIPHPWVFIKYQQEIEIDTHSHHAHGAYLNNFTLSQCQKQYKYTWVKGIILTDLQVKFINSKGMIISYAAERKLHSE